MATEVIDFEADWNARLLSRLQAQFTGKTTWTAWCALLARQAQDWETAAATLVALLSIADAVGTQLDVIGLIVGQQRSAGVSTDDATYRLYLLARVAANRSDGTPEAIYPIFRQLFGATVGQRITRSRIKQFLLELRSPITAPQAMVALDFLGDAKGASDGAQLAWQQAPDSAMFACAGGSVLAVPANPGDTTITVVDGSGYALSGSGVLDQWYATSEAFSWVTVVGGVVTLTAPLASAHARGAAAEPNGAPGIGFGDSTNPATGGQLAGVAIAV